MRVSSEFLHLCQEQVNLLTYGLGATLAIVALLERPTQTLDEGTISFLPILTYPQAFDNVDPQALRLWLNDIWIAERKKSSSLQYENGMTSGTDGASVCPNPSVHSGNTKDESQFHDDVLAQPWMSETSQSKTVTIIDGALGPRVPLVAATQNQIVMPLMYQDVLVGLLVTARGDRGWNQPEKYEVERVGQTLSAAYILEQRSQWLEQRLHQQASAYAQIQDQQQDVLGDVLHQFRNPLTALRTFGKLLTKRLQPADRNRTVAESIVRESDRLQDLLKQLSSAAEIPSIALPSIELTMPAASTHTTILIPGRKEAEASEPRFLNADYPSNGVNRNQQDGATTRCERTDKDGAKVLFTNPGTDPSDMVKALTGQDIQIKTHDPMEILGPLLLSANAIAQDRHLELCVTRLEHHMAILADSKALREVLSNLIDNALKYTPNPGRIDIVIGIERQLSMLAWVEDDGDINNISMHGIAIADTGPGIPVSDQEHLFERHFRGVQHQSKIPGTGLGLAIAQLLTQQMNGNIEFFSPITSCPFDEIQAILHPAQQFPPLSISLSRDLAHYDTDLSRTLTDSSKSNSPENNPPIRESNMSRWVNSGPGTIFIVWLPTP